MNPFSTHDPFRLLGKSNSVRCHAGWIALLIKGNQKVLIAQWSLSGLVMAEGLVYLLLYAMATDKSSAAYSEHKANNSAGLLIFGLFFIVIGANMLGSLVVAKVIRWIYCFPA